MSGGEDSDLLWGYFYEDVEPGMRMQLGVTLDPAHVVLAVGLFADPGPNHLDEEHAAGGRFGSRVVHGPLSVGLMTGVLGQYFGQSIVALADLAARFRRPVYPGDTLRCAWTVVDKEPREDLGGGGLVKLGGTASVERDGEDVPCVLCEATLAVGSRSSLGERILKERRGG